MHPRPTGGTLCRESMRGALLFLLLALLSLPTGAAAAEEWQIIRHNNQDYVTLENVGRFYQLGSVQRVGNQLSLRTQVRSLRGSIGSKEFYINNLKFILSHPIEQSGGKPIISRMDLTKLIEPILRPSRISSARKIDTVVLDAGHGGHDHGARSPYGHEKAFSLDVALRARLLLQRAGFKVVLTRTGDTFIPLEQRARFANRYPNAIFISIHFNSARTMATGLETYTLAPRGVPSMASDGPKASDFVQLPGNARDAENIALACATHAALVYNSRMFDRGIKRARFVVIREITIPGVLIEGGFLSNPQDARRIATPAYRQQMAGSILQAVQNYRNAVGNGTRASGPVASHDALPKAPGPRVITTPSRRQ